MLEYNFKERKNKKENKKNLLIVFQKYLSRLIQSTLLNKRKKKIYSIPILQSILQQEQAPKEKIPRTEI